jgi:hypothetical protein
VLLYKLVLFDSIVLCFSLKMLNLLNAYVDERSEIYVCESLLRSEYG